MPVLKRRINKTRHEGCRVDALSLAGDPRATELPRFAPIFKRLDNLHHRRHHRRDRLLVATSFGWDSAGIRLVIRLVIRPGLASLRPCLWQAGPSLASRPESRRQKPHGGESPKPLTLAGRPDYALASSKAESNARADGEKSSFLVNSQASRAPNSRSMPLSSHSIESGP